MRQKQFKPLIQEDGFSKAVSLLLVSIMSYLVIFLASYAWFGQSVYESKVLVFGKISVVAELDLSDVNVLEPGKIYENYGTIIGNSDPENLNTNDAFIKAKLETNIKVNGENILIPLVDDELWIVDENNEWYYYVGYVNNSLGATFNTGGLMVNTNITNDIADEEIIITFTVYAIQRDYSEPSRDIMSPFAHDEWKNAPAAWKLAIQDYAVED